MQTMEKWLSQLTASLNAEDILSVTSDDVPVTGLFYDSRKIRQGHVFFCIRGEKTDGHQYIPQALANGAVALITEEAVVAPVPVVVVKNTRMAASRMANVFFEQPSQKLRVFGVTGTNGKTTTTYLIEAILKHSGRQVGLIGTIRSTVGGQDQPMERTTPEGIDLHEMLYHMVQAADDSLVMEVSSHALDLHRVDGCEYDIGVFTNLTQDHLDYHKTMENYLLAKIKLFAQLKHTGGTGKGVKGAVINLDDPAAERIISMTHVPMLTYGIDHKADLQAVDVHVDHQGTRYTLAYQGRYLPMTLKIAGLFNVYNTLAAAGAAIIDGISLETIKEALETFKGVPGRFQLVQEGQDFAVIVDYAHTPDGLENVLKAARAICRGQLIVVFGCGGDRDRTKRPIMGRIAGNLSDYTIVTSDNPRTEDPVSILKEIEPGVAAVTDAYEMEIDRHQAIHLAIQMAKPNDVVVIAGKGHENYQVLRERTIHFDDFEEAQEALRRLRA